MPIRSESGPYLRRRRSDDRIHRCARIVGAAYLVASPTGSPPPIHHRVRVLSLALGLALGVPALAQDTGAVEATPGGVVREVAGGDMGGPTDAAPVALPLSRWTRFETRIDSVDIPERFADIDCLRGC